jgi:hypothetical protein
VSLYSDGLILLPRFAIELPDDLNKQFRMKIIEVYGSEKGAVTKAIIDAVRLWLREKDGVRKR